MGTAPLFISNFSPQIGIRRWALQCLKHHFPNLWCGKHDLIPVQCFSSDSPSLQIVFVWHHIEGVIVHHCGWWTATSSGKTSSKNYSQMLQPKYERFLISAARLGNFRCCLCTLISCFSLTGKMLVFSRTTEMERSHEHKPKPNQYFNYISAAIMLINVFSCRCQSLLFGKQLIFFHRHLDSTAS